MADCEQCAALQRQNDLLANDRDGYVQLLTDENNKLRAENEKFKMSLSDVVQQTQEQADTITALRAENERLKEWNWEIAVNAREFAAENEKLRAALELFACDCIDSGNLCPSPQNCRNYIARAALEGK